MKKTGSEIIIHILEALGVKIAAGIPGSSILPLYDALSKSSIRHIAVRQEQAGGFLAQGIARSTGDVGVCFATSGPGAMNLLTAIADARSDSVPIVAITGQVNSKLIGTDAFQEADTFGLSFPITKHSFMVKSVEELFTVIPEAFKIAISGRPGPVLIDVPIDIQSEVLQFDEWPEIGTSSDTLNLVAAQNSPSQKASIFHTTPAEYAERTKKIVSLLYKSKKPVLLLGGGCNNFEASKEIRKFISTFEIPVVSTLMGLGAVPKSDKNFIGMIGIHGSDAANSCVHDSDLLIAVGTRFDERATRVFASSLENGHDVESLFCPKAKIVHIDIDAAEINKIISSDVSIVADAQSVFPILTSLVLEKEKNGKTESENKAFEARKKWIMKFQKKRDTLKKISPSKKGFVNPAAFISEIPSLAEKHGIKKSDIIVTTDVGQHQVWAAKYFPVENPRSFLTSGSLGTMGFGLPAAIGASLSNSGKNVICFSGDGSILMNIQELQTLSELNLPVTIFVFQNKAYGLVKQMQKYKYSGNYSASVFESNPDFVSIAKGFGIEAVNAKDDCWEKFAFSGKPCLVVVETDTEEEA